MVQVRCPQCGSLVEGIEGQEAVCGHCGFRAQLPVLTSAAMAAPSPVPPPVPTVPPATDPPRLAATPNPTPTETPIAPLSANAILAVWGYILGVAAVATFFLANFGLPFAFGVAALVLGIVARQREPQDRRAMVAIGLGGFAILAAILWLVA